MEGWQLGVLIGDPYVYLQLSLIQNFVLLLLRTYFGKVVQNFELKRVGGA